MECNYKNEGFSVPEILPGVYLCEMDEMDMLRHTFMRMGPVQLRQHSDRTSHFVYGSPVTS